jgi:hypothetical protein
MGKLFCCLLACLAIGLLAGCGRESTPTSPGTPPATMATDPVDTELAAAEVVLACGWDFDAEVAFPASLANLLDKNGHCIVRDFQREVLVGDIVHYSLVLSVGPGEYDVIGLHRVVRERRPYVPIRAPQSLFLVHGMGKDFTGCFLPGRKSPLLPDDFGFAVFMAQHDVDVWGIDSSYLLVPLGVGDFSFAQDWGMDKCIDDIETGVAVARLVRLFTGNGLRKMTLGGYSQGGLMGFGLLNRETQLRPGRRTIGSYISMDSGLGSDDPYLKEIACASFIPYLERWEAGIYAIWDDPDGFYYDIGYFAQTDPYGSSPYYGEFTNLQVFLFFTATSTPPSTEHYWAASFDESEMPVDFTYTTRVSATEFWMRWAPMNPPTHQWVDINAILCGENDSAWETHLGEVDMPVLSLEAAGGGGPGQAGTLDRLVNADVTRHVVRILPPEDAWLDFGHVDLFTAENAAVEAWQPTLDWIESQHGRDVPDLPEPVVMLEQEQFAAIRALEWAPPAGHWLNDSQSIEHQNTLPAQSFRVPPTLESAIGRARWHDFSR